MNRSIWGTLVLVAAAGGILWHWAGRETERKGERQPRIVWIFEPAQRGGFVAGLGIQGERLVAAVVRDAGLGVTSGAVYCLDRSSGRPLWEFDDAGRMLQTISAPRPSHDRVYVGEGLHGDIPCQVRALTLDTGELVWRRGVGGHIESSPVVYGDLLLVTAGDDGVQAIDRETGEVRWVYRGSGHVDAAPCVVGDRVYSGSGVSKRFSSSEVFCLDGANGRPLWRLPVDLPVWGSPVQEGGKLFVPLGNGRLTSSEPHPGTPAGALVCIDVENREILWRFNVSDGALAMPAVGDGRVHLVSRDGYLYTLDQRTGAMLWKRDLGSASVASPQLKEGRVYAVASEGYLGCFDAKDGSTHWGYDFAGYSTAKPRLLGSPLVERKPGHPGRVYVGTELRSGAGAAAVLFCLEEPE